jgi:hypothetical protein
MSSKGLLRYSYGTIKLSDYDIAEIKSLFRNFKLDIIESNIKLEISEKNFNKFIQTKQYQAFSKFTPEEIITGSTSLYLFGLIDREPVDVDVICFDGKSYEPFIDRSYSFDVPNYFGYRDFKVKKRFWNKSTWVTIDFFEFQDEEFIEYKRFNTHLIKIENPLNIIQKKFNIVCSENVNLSNKHYHDLKRILNF